MRFNRWLMFSLAVVALCAGAAQAQVSDSDFLSIVPVDVNIADNNLDTNFNVAIMVDHASTIAAIAIPLEFPGSPGLDIDQTVNTGGNLGVSYGPAGNDAGWLLKTSFIDGKSILLGFVSFSQVNPQADTLAYVYFDRNGDGTSAVVSLDTGIVNNQRLGMTDIAAQEFKPQWSGATITIGAPEPTISLSPTSMIFNSVLGTGNPPTQSVTITNVGAGSLSWTATTTQTWLAANPSSGTGNGATTVSVNTAGLTAGTYTGWVIITDPAASNSPESVFVSLNLNAPTLSASPPTLVFNGQVGGANPSNQNFTLSASSGAAIAWTGSNNQLWLDFIPTGGNTPNTVTASVDITGLGAGTFVDTILVTAANAANSPFPVPVILTVASPPLINLDPTSVAFTATVGGANPAPDTVALTNAGTGTLDYSTSTDQVWLSVTPGSGNAPANLVISADITGLGAGTLTGNVIVTSVSAANSPETVAVSLTIQGNPPTFDVTPTGASFTATEGDVTPSPAGTPVFINNTGGGTLSWTVLGPDSAWVTLSKSAGGSPDTLVVSVDPVGLSAGVYQEVFQISDPAATNNPVTITVDFEVFAGPPTIGVSPPSFTFNAIQGGANPANQTLSISNVGGSQALNWAATATQGWLSFSDIAGTAPSTTDLMIDITGLSNGTYEDTITVAATGATNTPQTVPVTLIIGEPPPSIALDPDSMLFTATLGGPNPAAHPLGITNVGGGTLNWTSDTDSPWLLLSDSAGTAPSTIQVSVDISGLPPATYFGEATVYSGNADNSPQIVGVTLVVNDLPDELQVTPTSLPYSAQEGAANPVAQSFKIENVGGGIMGWTTSTSAPWISSLDPASGSNEDDVFVFIDITGLTAGSYIDSVLVDAGSAINSPQWVLINLEITPPPPPSIVLSPTSFTFSTLFGGSNPATQFLDITNGGGRTLQWTATNGSSWLSLSDASGIAPSTVSLDVDITGLTIGTYSDTIMILSDSADNSPQMAIVQLDVVDDPPFMELSSTEFFFEMVIGDPDPPCQALQIDNSGAGTLNWTASKNAAWLSLSSSSGAAPSSVDFCVTGTGLIPGTYRDTVAISSNEAINSPQDFIVTFVVKSVDKPSIVLQPDSLYFIVNQGQESDPQCTYVWIDGNGGRLIWRAVTDASWISLSRDSCNISYPLCVTVNSTSVEPGVYCDTVEISGDADNSPQYLTICMDVRSGGEQPVLQVLNSEYFFTATEGDVGLGASQTFMVNNTGTGVLNWTAATLATWVAIDPTSGTAPSNGTYRVDPTGVSAGTYQATVEFDAPGALNSPAFVQINLTVMAPQEEPVLAVNPMAIAKTVSVGSTSVTEVLNIFNTGTGSLTWSLNTVDFATWLSASDASGSAPGVSTITLNPAGLTAGVYVDTIVVTSPEAGNSPVGVPVSLTVTGGGQDLENLVWVGFDTSMPGETVMLPVYFENDQPLFGVSVPLTWTGEGVWADSVSFAGSRVDGIDILAASVDTMLREIRIGVIPQTDPVPAGTGLLCNVWFTVSGASPNQTVMVDTMTTSTPAISLSYVDTTTTEFVPGFTDGLILVTGAQPPVLAVSPDSLHFEATAGGSNPADESVTVLNTGGGFLTFSVSDNAPWLSLNPTSGAQGDSVFFQVDINGLSQNLYSGVATFISAEAGDTVVVPVTLNVAAGAEPPVIALSPNEVNFNTIQGTIPAAVPITVLNTGSGSLNWTATKSQPWLGILPATGTDGTVITVSVTDDQLSPGLYVDTITVSDPAATNSPQLAVVSLTVSGPPSPDTIFVGHVSGNPGDTVEVAVRVKNSFTATAITLPFTYDGSGVDVVFPGALTTPRSGPAVFTIFSEAADITAKTALYGFLAFGDGMPAGDGDVLIMKFAIAPDAPPQTIAIDTTMLPPANVLSLVDASAQEIFPDFVAGSITVLSPGGSNNNSIWITDAAGESGDQVTVEVHAVNSDPIERLLLPLQLTSMDMSIVGAEYLGTRSESGTPSLTVVDDQHFTLDIDWSAQPLAPGSGPVARLIVQLDDLASPQTAYVDTAGDYGFSTSGGSQGVVVPQFTRGEVRLDVAASTDDPLLPFAFALKPNYPNPFNPTTSIAYTISESGHARLSIYNTLGRLVVTLVDQYQSAGDYDVLWNGRDLTGAQVPSGVYLYRLQAGTEVALRKMTLMK